MITKDLYESAKLVLNEYHDALGRGEEPEYQPWAEHIVKTYVAQEIALKAANKF